MDRLVIPTEHLTAVHPLPQHALRDPWMTMHETDVGKVRAWFNASSIVHKGIRWMAYRTECRRWFLWSRISLVQLDEQFMPISGTNTLLPLHTRFDGWGAEDPRLFSFEGILYLTYGDGYRVLLACLNDKGEVVRSQAIPADKPDLNPPQKHPREKNWGFFVVGDHLFCQYGVSPLVTLEFNIKTWKVTNRWESPWRWSSLFGMKLHGGSPPVFHEGTFWRWVHCHRIEKLPTSRASWFSDKPQATGHRYYPHLLQFSAEPPFEPLNVSQTPIFQSAWEPPNSDGPTHYSVVYVGSSEREGAGWRIFYGENDCRICTALVPDELAMRSLMPIEKPKPKKIRPARTNFLHFIWVQGEEFIPNEDAAHIEEWKAMNPDWVICVWDDESLSELIAKQAPGWTKAWEELAAQREAHPDDTALVAKASDMARLILLWIRFSPAQEWNVYADTDTKPMRSLTDFANDDTLYGGNFPKHNVFDGPMSEKPWDIDDYDLLVVEENLQTPQRGFMTNAVMMSRPETLPINALLKAGALTRNQPTLKAWGPIMLRRSIEALKRTPDGRRVYMLPFHYFVWNPAQMQQVSPPWCVCFHLNKFRWHQEGVRTSSAGHGKGRRGVLV